MWERLARASIWHPDAIPPDEWKYRNLKRVWLPIYDSIAIACGLAAAFFGSPILNRLFRPDLVDVLGGLLAITAAVCLAGVAFPRLWRIEMVGKVLLVGLVGAYVSSILLFSDSREPNLFVVGMLLIGLPLAFFRLELLGEEWKERRGTDA